MLIIFSWMFEKSCFVNADTFYVSINGIFHIFFCTTQFFLYFIIFSNKKVFEIADLNDCYMSIIFLEKLMLVPFSKLKWVYLCG